VLTDIAEPVEADRLRREARGGVTELVFDLPRLGPSLRAGVFDRERLLRWRGGGDLDRVGERDREDGERDRVALLAFRRGGERDRLPLRARRRGGGDRER
jgi:hypothetical protein